MISTKIRGKFRLNWRHNCYPPLKKLYSMSVYSNSMLLASALFGNQDQLHYVVELSMSASLPQVKVYYIAPIVSDALIHGLRIRGDK